MRRSSGNIGYRGESHEHHDTGRLSERRAHTQVLRQTRRPERHDLERPHEGHGNPGRAAEGYGSARFDPRAHADPCAADRASAQAQTHQPAQRLSAYRRRRLYAAWRDRVVRHESGQAVLFDGGADLGADHRGDAPDPAGDDRDAGRPLAVDPGARFARPHARHFRLRAHRRRDRWLRQGLRHERARLGARGKHRAGSRRRACSGGRARRRSSRNRTC